MRKNIFDRARQKTTGRMKEENHHHQCSSIQHENGGLEEQYLVSMNNILSFYLNYSFEMGYLIKSAVTDQLQHLQQNF